MAACPKCGMTGFDMSGLGRDDLLATMFATMTRDLENSIDRRLEAMENRIISAMKGFGDDTAKRTD